MPNRAHASSEQRYAPDGGRPRRMPLPVDSRLAVLALQRTAGNQAVARWLGGGLPGCQPQPSATADVSGPRAAVIAALEHTIEQLQEAIAARDSYIGHVPETMTAALCRFFPGFKPQSLDDVLARLQPMTGWIPGIEVVSVNETRPPHRDAEAIKQVRKIADKGRLPAFSMVRAMLGIAFPDVVMAPGPDYIVLLQPWDAAGDRQPTILLHEYFHVCLEGMADGDADPLHNPDAWQGFVSVLGGLKTGKKIDKNPPCQ
jgi:hypothetical protein